MLTEGKKGLLNRYRDDRRCADVWSARQALGTAESDRPAESHLRTCSECRARYAPSHAGSTAIRTDAHAEADEAFTARAAGHAAGPDLPPPRGLEHPARIIAFPRSPVQSQFNRADAGAGLPPPRPWPVTGVGLGQLFDMSRPRQAESMAQTRVSTPLDDPRPGRSSPPRPVHRRRDLPVRTGSHLVQARVPDSLQYLNAITPGARDYDPR